MNNVIKLILLLATKVYSQDLSEQNVILRFTACLGTNIVAEYKYGLPVGEENQYTLIVPSGESPFKRNVTFDLDFNSDADAETVLHLSLSSIIRAGPPRSFRSLVVFQADVHKISFRVRSLETGVIPYLTSVKIDNVEKCERPLWGYLNNILLHYTIAREVRNSVPDDNNCGRRKINGSSPNEPVTEDARTEPGDWPWHAAVYHAYRENGELIYQYRCGGTLISKLFVVTVAYCALIDGRVITPELLSVRFGKYKFAGGDVSLQKRRVYSVIVHKFFTISSPSEYNIALLKLKLEVNYSDYVQPACIWNGNVAQNFSDIEMTGTVVGWRPETIYGRRTSSNHLMKATLSVIPMEQCMPYQWGHQRSKDTFCAANKNESSVVIGESGTGFTINVPETSRSDPNSKPTDRWYLRGIVSQMVSSRRTTGDPEEYIIFTDISKHEEWIRIKTYDDIYRNSYSKQ